MEWDFNMKRNRALFLVLCIALIVGVIAIQPSQPAEAATNRQVWAYYMGFWGTSPEPRRCDV
jgi:hypothetical protein